VPGFAREQEKNMKLYWSSRSPYVRKVMIAAHETGLVGRLDCRRVIVSAYAENTDVLPVNPLGKIPTLVLDDGAALYDSPVICEYLDGLHSGPKLFPASGPARFEALRWLALGDGLLDMLLARMYEERVRPEEQRSQKLQDAIAVKLKACLDALEALAPALEGTPVNIGHIAIGCALGYLDFRFAGDDWRAGRPALAAWQKAFAARPSVVATEPVDVY
jgi:glutathione S-transferase